MKAPGEDRIGNWLVLAAGLGLPALVFGAILVLYAPAQPTATAAPAVAAKTASAPAPAVPPPENPALVEFHSHIVPILEDNCYECHGDGQSKGGVAFDKLTTDDQILKNPELWFKVLKYTRTGVMPAEGNPPLAAADQATLDNWIKFAAFGVDPTNLDPGRVTVHRLNRVEYRNTIHDLLGVDYDTAFEFPSDDIGYGFDNIADVLNVSPMMMEKYLAAAQTVVDEAVPTTPRAVAESNVLGKDFLDVQTGSPPILDEAKTGANPALDNNTMVDGKVTMTAVKMSYFKEASVSHTFPIATEGDYKLVVEQGVSSNFGFIATNCTISISVDGKSMNQRVLPWHGANSNTEKQPSFYDTVSVHWTPGNHEVVVGVEPLDGVSDGKNTISFLLRSVTLQGPEDKTHWVHPPNYERFFTRDVPPTNPAERRAYAREVLRTFASKAFRRPVPEATLDKLVDLAEKEYTQPDKTFEMGVSQAMVAVLASPRFLFRIDSPAPGQSAAFAQVDEYSLASRLSYFFWSTMPDDELLKLAAAGQLRKNLDAQVQRMVADPRSEAFIKNFSEQWLQSRAVTTVPINTASVLLREGYKSTAADDLTPAQRTALAQETEAYFGYVMHNDRSVDEFIDSNYMFLNSTLANYYYYYDKSYAGNFKGDDMRKVELPAGDWRGGVLTMGSVLMVTSNPTRTSPVKRGKWILENILGAPIPPPPPNLPSLDEAEKDIQDHTPTQREVLAHHRADPNCASCHDRMDPLGLSLENFNALGTVRFTDMDQTIDASGKLSTGDAFKDIRDLKHILITNHREEFYRCLTEKLLTYALGRGTEYYDVATVDKIVENLDKNGGHFSALLQGVINSAAFQEERTLPASPAHPSPAAKPMALLTPNTSTHEQSPN